MPDFVVSEPAPEEQEPEAGWGERVVGRKVFTGAEDYSPVSLEPRDSSPVNQFDGDLWSLADGLYYVSNGTANRVPKMTVSATAPVGAQNGDLWLDTGDVAFTEVTPVLSAATTSPTGWNSAGGYYRMGPLVVYRFQFVATSSVTAGTGNYRISVPVAAKEPSLSISQTAGTVACWDSNVNARALVTAIFMSGIGDPTYFEGRYNSTWPGGTNTPLQPGGPFTWADGDQISGTIVYEAAV